MLSIFSEIYQVLYRCTSVFQINFPSELKNVHSLSPISDLSITIVETKFSVLLSYNFNPPGNFNSYVLSVFIEAGMLFKNQSDIIQEFLLILA
jgi:hypothetical protein